ncbi:hypothetical protein psal_cds_1063 [Pandoravirus salinus]|uniref:DUF5848 domain-containing protein n=1 Tax=Pandoravirus salinus TaxID=1349410 RepID=S4W4K4_9VIRU|nr:hypothetical protein psal_cds_1063 [Pandoravirus salinus]AGO85270.1 hypothetical protein psal_cds_1063 [Pandoravirus salinus]
MEYPQPTDARQPGSQDANTNQCYFDEFMPRGQYVSPSDRRAAEFLEHKAALEFAPWQRAEQGTGSQADVAEWARFSIIDPADPQALERIAAHDRVRPSVAASCLYKLLWATIDPPPHLALPSFTDVIDAAMQVVGPDGADDIRRAVAGLKSLDRSTRRRAIATIGEMLEARRVGDQRQGRHPFYPVPMPRSLWAAALDALARSDAQDRPPRCDPQHAYYVLVAEGGDWSDPVFLAFLAGPHSTTVPSQTAETAVWETRVRYDGLTYRREPGQAPDRGDSPGSLPLDDVAAWITPFLVSLVLTVGSEMDTRMPRATSEPKVVSQVKRVLARFGDDIGRIPTSAGLTPALMKAIPRGPTDLWGAWIGECQLVAALTVFAGQVLARRASPLFTGPPLTLFDATVDASAMSRGRRPALPLDVIERSAPRLWQRVCSAPATDAGTLVGADLLPDVARASGIAVGDAEIARPELLCQPLALPLVQAQATTRYGPSLLSPSQQSLVAHEGAGQYLYETWKRSCNSNPRFAPGRHESRTFSNIAKSTGVSFPTEPGAFCAALAPVMMEPPALGDGWMPGG